MNCATEALQGTVNRRGGSAAASTTPLYPFDEDIVHWHRVAHDLCAVRR
jgi:coproporphyrinogen III oxidase